jgi:diguanylate cyclase (GGDEF)-like protein
MILSERLVSEPRPGAAAPARGDGRGARSVTELEQKIRDLEVLQAFSATLLHYKDDVDDILWDVARQAVAKLGLEDCVIYLIDESKGDLVQRAAYGPKNPRARDIFNPIRLRPGQGIVGSCAAESAPICIGDTRLDPRYVEDDEARLSELAVPILHDGRVIGVIDSEHSEPAFFTLWHVGIFTTLAAMTASRIVAARLEQKRIELATRDHLTGLMNRAEFFRVLEARLGRVGSEGAVLLVNLDHFGVVNEWLGPSGGDHILQAAAQRLLSASPVDTVVARIGGDEFALVLSMDFSAAESLGRQLLTVLAQPYSGIEIEGLKLAASAGIAALGAGETAAGLMQCAALALREAKQSGRGRLQVHDAGLARRLLREQRLARDLAREIAADAEGLCAHFQPIVRVADVSLAGAEVLARWQHPELGPVGPQEFVSAAEHSGHIHELGRHIYRRAFRSLASWGPAASTLVLNINVSPLQIQRDGFLEQMLAMLDEFRIAPARIACEVTESTLLADEEQSSRVLGSLLERGLKLVLDDFGTGYASLGTLTRYPFSGVKIDRSFVRHIDRDRRRRAVVRSVISMSNDLGLSCTAEGIETEAQLDILRGLGCGLGQGWLFSAAVPAESFRTLIDA